MRQLLRDRNSQRRSIRRRFNGYDARHFVGEKLEVEGRDKELLMKGWINRCHHFQELIW